MKRGISLIVILALSLVVCACGAKEPELPTWQEQYDLGVRYLSEGNYEEAIIAFTAAIKIDPMRAEAYVGRGDAYVAFDSVEENLVAAQADYEKALELDGSLVEIYMKLSDIYTAMDEDEQAKATVKKGYEVTDSENLKVRLDELSKPEKLEGYPKTVRRDYENGWYLIEEYDEFGRTIRWTEHFDDEHIRIDIESEYDDAGNLIYQKSDSYGDYEENYEWNHQLAMRFDEAGRMIWRKMSSNDSVWEESYDYTDTPLVKIDGSCIHSESWDRDYSASLVLEMENEKNTVQIHSWGSRVKEENVYYGPQIDEYAPDSSIVRACEYNEEGMLMMYITYEKTSDGSLIYQKFWADGTPFD